MKDFIKDPTQYLEAASSMQMVRVVTIGSVDDGKSTMIGRILYDCDKIYNEDLADLKRASTHYSGTTPLDLSRLTDGLKAEREQGITIDVAYRYFSSGKRRFALADCPGHEIYTRNAVTGISRSHLAILLISAKQGLMPQSLKHARLISLMRVPQLVVAINKMDTVDYDYRVFNRLASDFVNQTKGWMTSRIDFVPCCATNGDNIVYKGSNLDWYQGRTILGWLEDVEVATPVALEPLRYMVQGVLRGSGQGRYYSGVVARGKLAVGDEVLVLPSRQRSQVNAIRSFDGEFQECCDNRALSISFSNDLDVERGSMIVHPQNPPIQAQKVKAVLVWMTEAPSEAGFVYLLQHGHREVEARIISAIIEARQCYGENLRENQIAEVQLELKSPLYFDSFAESRETGSLILIHKQSCQTVACGMLLGPGCDADQSRATLGQGISHIAKKTLWFTGLPAAGKTTIIAALKMLISERVPLVVIDGDELRSGVNCNLGFSNADRFENLRRAAEICKLLNKQGFTVLAGFVSPKRLQRAMVKNIIGLENIREIYVATSLEICKQRDPKGLYKKAIFEKTQDFTGISDSYEPPHAPYLRIETSGKSPQENALEILEFVTILGAGTI